MTIQLIYRSDYITGIRLYQYLLMKLPKAAFERIEDKIGKIAESWTFELFFDKILLVLTILSNTEAEADYEF